MIKIEVKKILILDDHEIFGLGLGDIIAKESDMEVMAILTDYKLLEMHINQHQPDIIICAIRLKEANGLKLVKYFKGVYSDIKFIVMSGYNLPIYKKRAHEFGASAFLLKEDSIFNIVKTIREVIKGDIIIPNNYDVLLSSEELDILRLLANDLTNKEISEKIFMSKRNVEYRISNIIHKLGVNSRAGAVIKSIKMGLIDEQDIIIVKK